MFVGHRSVFGRSCEAGYHSFPRDYRMYPVAAFLEKVFCMRTTLQPALAGIGLGRNVYSGLGINLE